MDSKEWNKQVIRNIIQNIEIEICRMEFGEYEIAIDAEKIIRHSIEELKFLIGDLQED